MAANRAEPREHSRDVAIENSVFCSKRNAKNRSAGVGADAGQRENRVFILWKFSTMLRHDLLRCLLQIARATVIAEARPQPEHFFLRRFCESMPVGESRQKSFVVRNHGSHARLLQHDFRNPDAVRIFRAPPRQIALKLPEPCEQLLAKRDEFAASERDHAVFSHS